MLFLAFVSFVFASLDPFEIALFDRNSKISAINASEKWESIKVRDSVYYGVRTAELSLISNAKRALVTRLRSDDAVEDIEKGFFRLIDRGSSDPFYYSLHPIDEKRLERISLVGGVCCYDATKVPKRSITLNPQYPFFIRSSPGFRSSEALALNHFLQLIAVNTPLRRIESRLDLKVHRIKLPLGGRLLKTADGLGVFTNVARLAPLAFFLKEGVPIPIINTFGASIVLTFNYNLLDHQIRLNEVSLCWMVELGRKTPRSVPKFKTGISVYIQQLSTNPELMFNLLETNYQHQILH